MDRVHDHAVAHGTACPLMPRSGRGPADNRMPLLRSALPLENCGEPGPRGVTPRLGIGILRARFQMRHQVEAKRSPVGVLLLVTSNPVRIGPGRADMTLHPDLEATKFSLGGHPRSGPIEPANDRRCPNPVIIDAQHTQQPERVTRRETQNVACGQVGDIPPWPPDGLPTWLWPRKLFAQFGQRRLALRKLRSAGLLPEFEPDPGIDDVNRLDLDLIVKAAELGLCGR